MKNVERLRRGLERRQKRLGGNGGRLRSDEERKQAQNGLVQKTVTLQEPFEVQKNTSKAGNRTIGSNG